MSSKTKEVIEPLNDQELKASARLIEKLHRRTGHPSSHALASTLKHRGAHWQVVEMAEKYQCSECQELKLAPLSSWSITSQIGDSVGDPGV